MMTVGLFLIRVIVGMLLIGHAAQKLFGWFGGHGLAGTGAFFDSVGYRPGRRLALLAGLAELTGGLLLTLGLLTPLAAAVIVGTMTAAAAIHMRNGLWVQNGGYETPLLYAVTALGVAFTGPGGVSLDRLFGLSWPWPYGLYAATLGLLTALPFVMMRRRRLAKEQGQPQRNDARLPKQRLKIRIPV
ncbi:DoxX family protein [Streptomyces sp. NPDC049627]|uniref:DoxX family protein n=1 Tax=Streptomyces sp. NPDC049627 TaxID=3365595 RepID=UPI0037A94F70